jgi:hypothetical protein
MKKILVLGLMFALVSCSSDSGHNSPPADEGFTDSEVQAMESGLGAMNSSLNDDEQVNSYAQLKRQPLIIEILLPTAYAANQCDRTRFTPMLPASSCAGTHEDRTAVVDFNGCSPAGYWYITLHGQVQLLFDTPTTCSEWVNMGPLPTSGSVVRTTSNYKAKFGRLSVTLNTNYQDNYLAQDLGGGVVTNFTASGREMNILGLHREGFYKNVQGTEIKVFDHTISTPTPIVVTGTKAAGSRVVHSGSLKIDHNLAGYSLDASVANLQYSNNCCYPTAGSLDFTRSGAKSGSMQVDFSSTCGQVSITMDGETKTKNLNSCE